MNRNPFVVILVLCFSLVLPAGAQEQIALQTKTIDVEGRIVERNEESIRVDIGGVVVTFFEDELVDQELHSNYQKLVNWITSNISHQTNLPRSFYVPEDIKDDIYANIGLKDSVSSIIERMIIEEGLSLYDAALVLIIYALQGDNSSIAHAEELVNIFWEGQISELRNIRAGGYPSQPYIYDLSNREAVSSDLSDYGKRGFLFRIINANGRYNTTDPLDGKTFFSDFPNWNTVHWEDWKPIAGENAWVVLGALHILQKKLQESENPSQVLANSTELRLAEEIARAALLLQADNGGIRMAPLGAFHYPHEFEEGQDLSDIEAQMEEEATQIYNYIKQNRINQNFEKMYKSPYYSWFYHQISTENNLSWYAALRALYHITGKEEYKVAMNKIEGYFQLVWNAETHTFYQGMHYSEDQWHFNDEHFATDVQNWAVLALGPELIDQWFGKGASFEMWKQTRNYSGYFKNGELLGVGYTQENDRLSVEWTVGAIMNLHLQEKFYRGHSEEIAQKVKKDALSMKNGIEQFRYDLSNQQTAYSYSSKRGWIPFGWFSADPEILSMTSTCWVALLKQNFNPFDLQHFLSSNL